jgi:sodium-dependent dicarboxylate transporter 2/3/5
MTHLQDATSSPVVRWAGLVGAPLVAVAVYMLLAGAAADGSLPESGRRVIGVAVLMAGWWLTEAVPLAATSLVPLVLFPLLGVMPMKAAAAPYADELIFLFLGGFLLGRAFERSGLHRRVALLTLLGVGSRPRAVIAGVMGATACISMWVSNTATAIMMMPIALSLVALVEHSVAAHGEGSHGWDGVQVRRFTIALLLGLAYGASIGGMGTPLGTPPNLTFVSTARELLGEEFSFYRWSKVGAPMVAILMPLAWVMLVYVLHPVKAKSIPGGKDFVRSQLSGLGRVRVGEAVTLGVFVVAVSLWIGREWLTGALELRHVGADGKTWAPLTDGVVAIAAALALFLIPAGGWKAAPVLHSSDVETVPWSILLLFGGGLSLAAAMKASGVDLYLGSLFTGLHGLPRPVLLLVIVASITLLSELASNTAVAAATLPVLASAAGGLGVHPYVLMIPATLAASCGFMLPVATPPNAIVFGSGRISMRQMLVAGMGMDAISVVVIVLFFWALGPTLLSI